MLFSLAGFVAPRLSAWCSTAAAARQVPYDADALPLHEEPGSAIATSTEPGCGHLAIEHGDHVDYVHDGHRHAVHVTGEGQHYDEH